MNRSQLWIRGSALAAIAVMGTTVLAGCSQSGESEDVVIRVGDPFSDVWGEPLEQAAAAYEEENPGVTIELESVPYDGFADVYQTQLVGGSAADILFVEPPNATSFADRDFLAPLNEELSPSTEWGKTFVDGILDATRSADGNQYLVPWSSVAVLVAYRDSLYEEAGVDASPANWGEWIDAMEALDGGDVSPLNVSLRGDDASTWWLLTNKLNATLRPLTEQINLIHAEGWSYNPEDLSSTVGEVYSTDELYVAFKKGLIDPAKSPGYRAAVEQVAELMPFLNEDTATVQPGDVVSQFAAGEVPQIVSVGQAIADAASKTDDVEDFVTFDLPTITREDYAGLTAGEENPLAGPRMGFVVNAASEVQDEAIEFLKYLTSAETVTEMYAVQPQGDPSAIVGVTYPDGSVLPEGSGQKWAEIPAYSFGMPPTFDSADFDEFNAQWQKFLTGNSTIDEFLEARSASNLAALERNLVLNADSIDQSFIDEQLGE